MAVKIERNRAIIKFGYHSELVLPIKEALLIMEQLEFAEEIDSNNYEMLKIKPYNNEITIKIISDSTYKKYKSNNLLDPEKG